MICFYLRIYKKIYFNNKKCIKIKIAVNRRKIESCNRQKEEKMRGQIVEVSPVKFLFEIIDIILVGSVR